MPYDNEIPRCFNYTLSPSSSLLVFVFFSLQFATCTSFGEVQTPFRRGMKNVSLCGHCKSAFPKISLRCFRCIHCTEFQGQVCTERGGEMGRKAWELPNDRFISRSAFSAPLQAPGKAGGPPKHLLKCLRLDRPSPPEPPHSGRPPPAWRPLEETPLLPQPGTAGHHGPCSPLSCQEGGRLSSLRLDCRAHPARLCLLLLARSLAPAAGADGSGSHLRPWMSGALLERLRPPPSPLPAWGSSRSSSIFSAWAMARAALSEEEEGRRPCSGSCPAGRRGAAAAGPVGGLRPPPPAAPATGSVGAGAGRGGAAGVGSPGADGVPCRGNHGTASAPCLFVAAARPGPPGGSLREGGRRGGRKCARPRLRGDGGCQGGGSSGREGEAKESRPLGTPAPARRPLDAAQAGSSAPPLLSLRGGCVKRKRRIRCRRHIGPAFPSAAFGRAARGGADSLRGGLLSSDTPLR